MIAPSRAMRASIAAATIEAVAGSAPSAVASIADSLSSMSARSWSVDRLPSKPCASAAAKVSIAAGSALASSASATLLSPAVTASILDRSMALIVLSGISWKRSATELASPAASNCGFAVRSANPV